MHWQCVIGFLSLLFLMSSSATAQANSIAPCCSVIGTAEQPTIEGGWINQAKSDREKYLPVADKRIDKASKKIDSSAALPTIPDEFSSDEAIKNMLTLAVKQHKLAYLLQRAERLQLPATVALIPMIESHYQTNAVSPQGAQGAWQFMPGTAKAYRLNCQTVKQFPASTDAALHLLNDLHQQFGNWTLAFAAYNAGSRRVFTALQQNPQAKSIEALDLPLETKQYVYRLKQLYQAIAHLPVLAISPYPDTLADKTSLSEML